MALQTLDMKIQQIMKGKFAHFMQKEIFEQPDSVVNTLRGRVRFDQGIVKLGGLADHIADIKRCRRLLFVACGTSYNSAIATRQFLEEVSVFQISVGCHFFVFILLLRVCFKFSHEIQKKCQTNNHYRDKFVVVFWAFPVYLACC